MQLQLTPDDVRRAHGKIQHHIHRTPVLTSRTLDRIVSTSSSSGAATPRVRLYFKCENFQKIGAFKARGAFHALKCLIEEKGIEEVRRKGVVAPSSGNHAQALAFAASEVDVPAYIVMPRNTAPSKVAGTRMYTDRITFSEPDSASREKTVASIMEQTGAFLIPPYNATNVLLGQGTCALELEEQVKELGRDKLNLVVSPLGGGGLLAGVVTYFADKPDTFVFGAEPNHDGSDDAKRGLEATPPTRIPVSYPITVADGLTTPVGPVPWDVLISGTEQKEKCLEGVRGVSEEQIKDAMRLLLERVKVFVEPSACVGLAALLYDEEFRSWIAGQQAEGEVWDVGLILTGGNTTVDSLVEMFA